MSEKSTQLFKESGGKLLTFLIGEQEYGIQILEAREVVGLMEIDPVPQTPKFMKGVINLRGKIIPVIDLRSKFGMEQGQGSSESCIVVVDIQGKLTGTIVDFLVGVVTIEEKDFEDSPDLGANINTMFITGMAKLDKRVIIVLDMENVLSNEELVLVHADH
ncbi:MAG: chemotaxis protein CheW [SAR324 cluster bacterium]|uniref:Chemotaxis protein CheW n=1 Tax=SAR324 cluster bacterium TaxID=2024889 RepID=A0A2A4TBK2_9DELT|nr:MAG: chemotaxis protein CheW [SAR324 cluster bacterium]